MAARVDSDTTLPLPPVRVSQKPQPSTVQPKTVTTSHIMSADVFSHHLPWIIAAILLIIVLVAVVFCYIERKSIWTEQFESKTTVVRESEPVSSQSRRKITYTLSRSKSPLHKW
jgi:Mg2+/citrate symporter